MAKKVLHKGTEFSKMRWVLRGDVLHIQIRGKEYNRLYGMSLNIPVKNFDAGDFSTTTAELLRCLTWHVTGKVKSRANTGVDYTRGFITAGTNKAGQPALLVRYAEPGDCFNPLRTLCGTVPSDVLEWVAKN